MQFFKVFQSGRNTPQEAKSLSTYIQAMWLISTAIGSGFNGSMISYLFNIIQLSTMKSFSLEFTAASQCFLTIGFWSFSRSFLQLRRMKRKPVWACLSIASQPVRLKHHRKSYNRDSHSVLGSIFLNPSVAAGVAFGSGGTQIHKGPAFTNRALYCRVNAQGKMELATCLYGYGSIPIDTVY